MLIGTVFCCEGPTGTLYENGLYSVVVLMFLTSAAFVSTHWRTLLLLMACLEWLVSPVALHCPGASPRSHSHSLFSFFTNITEYNLHCLISPLPVCIFHRESMHLRIARLVPSCCLSGLITRPDLFQPARRPPETRPPLSPRIRHWWPSLDLEYLLDLTSV